MHLKNIVNLSWIVGMWFVAGGAQGQETIKKDVRVVREYAPSVSDALKINQMPSREDTLAVTPRFDYQVMGKAMVAAPAIAPPAPAALAREPQSQLYPSYLHGGLGNYQLIFGELYYNLLRNPKYALALKLGQESSWGEIELENDRSVDAPYHQTDGSLYLRHFFDDKTLSLDLDFKRYAYRYYGYQTLDSGSNYFVAGETGPASRQVSGDALLPDPDQRYTTFDVAVGLAGQQANADELRYTTSLKFGTLGNKTGVGEYRFSAAAGVDKPLDAMRVKANAGIDYFKTNTPAENERPELWNFLERQQVLLTLNPRVVFPRERLTIEGGFNLTGVIDDVGGDEFYLAPHVTANLLVAESIVSVFGGLTGEVRPAGYRAIMAENPFVSPDVHVKSAFSNLLFFAGVKGNFSSTTSFSARLDYEFLDNEHFYVNRFYLDALTIGESAFTNLFDVIWDDGNLLTLSGELLVKPIPELNFLFKAAYYDWALDNIAHAWHKPEWEAGLRAEYVRDEQLRLSGALNLLGKRYAQDVTLPDLSKELDAVADLNLGADYQLYSRLNFFARVHNLLGSKYYRWNGYPMQGINFRVGAGYSF